MITQSLIWLIFDVSDKKKLEAEGITNVNSTDDNYPEISIEEMISELTINDAPMEITS